MPTLVLVGRAPDEAAPDLAIYLTDATLRPIAAFRPDARGGFTLPEEALANATPYLQAFGHVVLAWTWLDLAMACEGRGDDASQGRRAAMRYFFRYELPKTGAWLGVVAGRDPTCRDMRDGWF